MVYYEEQQTEGGKIGCVIRVIAKSVTMLAGLADMTKLHDSFCGRHLWHIQ